MIWIIFYQEFQEKIINTSSNKEHFSQNFETKKEEKSLNSTPLYQWKEEGRKEEKEEINNIEIKEQELLPWPKTEEVLEQLLLNSAFVKNEWESDNINFLLKVFEKNKDPKILNNILQLYYDEYQFISASQLLHQRENDPIYNQLKPELILSIEFNSFSLADDKAITKLLQVLYKVKDRISEETMRRYKGIISIMQKEYQNFFIIAKGFENPYHQAFASKLQVVSDTIHDEKDMPEYYIDALYAVELFHQGFFQPAKVLALKVMTENNKYILPYQILAYANFLTNSWSAAISYLEILRELDPTLTEKYCMILWVAHYRNKDYNQSILELSQVQNPKYLLDKERYLALNYKTLHQKKKLLESWEKILWYPNLRASDFYSYFYSVIFEPYQQNEKYDLYIENRKLYEKYLIVCKQKLAQSEQHLCQYGEIGKMMVEGKNDSFEKNLKELVKKTPQGYLYHLLGDRYLRKGDKENAQIFLSKAIWMTENETEKTTIKSLLREILE